MPVLKCCINSIMSATFCRWLLSSQAQPLFASFLCVLTWSSGSFLCREAACFSLGTCRVLGTRPSDAGHSVLLPSCTLTSRDAKNILTRPAPALRGTRWYCHVLSKVVLSGIDLLLSFFEIVGPFENLKKAIETCIV